MAIFFSGESTLIVIVSFPSPFVKRFNATETRISKLPSRGRMIVQKGRQMILSDSNSGGQLSSNPDAYFSLCTNSIEMVNTIFGLCDMLWNNAQPLTTLDVENHIKKQNSIKNNMLFLR